MKIFLAKSILIVIAVFLVNDSLLAQTENGWIKIATKTVNYNADKDEVTTSGKEKEVDKIRLRCTQGTVKIKKLTVVMANGNEKELHPKGTGVLTKGSASFSWDVPDGDTKIKKIILEYDAVGNVLITKRGKIEVEGRVKK